MFDIGISELGVIGVVALIVIGPERLPKVARTVGTLMGRAQRYVSDVKAEVSREMQVDELRKMKTSVQEAAREVQHSIHSGIQQTESEFHTALGLHAEEDLASAEHGHVYPPVSPSKRKNWRRNLSAKQSATPQWFRNVSRKRSRVLSGAARVARYRKSR